MTAHEDRRERLEMINSLLWFSMDALWMLDKVAISAVIGIPTILTSVGVLLLARSRELIAVDAAVFFWICMNYFWLMSEYLQNPTCLVVSKIGFACGLVCLGLSMAWGETWSDSLASFRRFRFRPIVKDV